MIKKKIQIAQSRQKSYADRRRRDLEFSVGDCVFLRSHRPKKYSGLERKASPQFIGPYEILERIGVVVYKLSLPPNFRVYIL